MKKILLLTIVITTLQSCGGSKNGATEKKVVCDSIPQTFLKNGEYVTEKCYKCDTLLEIKGVYKRIICDTTVEYLYNELGDEITLAIWKCDTVIVENIK